VEIIREHEARRATGGDRDASLEKDLSFLFGLKQASARGGSFERMERRFWALLRILARRGLIDKDEFLREFDD